MARVSIPYGRRVPVMDEEKRETIFRRLKKAKHTIEEKYHLASNAVDLGNALIDGRLSTIISVLKKIGTTKREIFEKMGRDDRKAVLLALHKASLEVIHPLTTREQSTWLENEYENERREILENIKEHLSPESPAYALIERALGYIPSLIYRNAKESRLGVKIAWIGEEEPSEESGKVCLVLSGGSAKGIVYHGLLKALEENELYPDFVVGTSAGALAGASFFSGRGVRYVSKVLSPRNLSRIFTPIQAPITLLLSGFSGILGMGFDRHLKKVFEERKMSEVRDVFVITSVQDPVGFGRTIIGRGSSLNANVELSSDIEVWKAVLGSCAIQGVVPSISINAPFRAERIVKGQLGVKREAHDMPYASLDDGSVVESLPLRSAMQMMEYMGERGLIIAVNLTNISPNRYKEVEHYTLKELLERNKSRIPLWGKVKAYGKWIAQEARRAFRRIAPIRALEGFEHMYVQNTIQAIRAAQGKGNIILLNLNYDGRLSELTLTNIGRNYAEVYSYGYEVGQELCRILLGD